MTGARRCRMCGCTDGNCRQCIETTGEPCFWVAPDLCSACVTTYGNDVGLNRAERRSLRARRRRGEAPQESANLLRAARVVARNVKPGHAPRAPRKMAGD